MKTISRALLGYSFVLLLNTCLEAAEFTRESLYTLLNDPSDLQLTNIQIQGEDLAPGDRVILEVSADIQNIDTGLFSSVSVGPEKLETFLVEYSYLNAFLSSTDELADGSEQSWDHAFACVVGNADAATAVSELEDGTALTLTVETFAGEILTNPPEVTVSATVVSQTTLVSGEILLECDISIANTLGETLSRVLLELDTEAATVGLETPPTKLFYERIEANDLETPDERMLIAIDSADLVLARAEILAGNALQISCHELWVFNRLPRSLDSLSLELFASASPTQLIFDGSSPLLEELQVDELIVYDPEENVIGGLDLEASYQKLSVIGQYLPFCVTNVQVQEDQVIVTGAKKDLLEVVQSGTFIGDQNGAYDNPARDPYDPTLENTYTEEEREDREEAAKEIEREDPRDGRLAELRGFNAVPWHFNDFPLHPKVCATGEFLLRSSGFGIEIKVREFELKRIAVRIDAGFELNMLVEVKQDEEDAEAEPPGGWVVELIDPEKLSALMPGLEIPIAGGIITVKPVINFDLGVDTNFPTSLTLPLQSALNVGVEMGWDRALEESTGDGYFYEPIQEVYPLRVSDPSFFDELSAGVSFWAQLRFGLEGDIVQAASVKPSVAVRLQNDFVAAPLEDPWWAIEAYAQVVGQFAFSALGFDLVDAEADLGDEIPLYGLDAGGPILPKPASSAVPAAATKPPVSGAETRWVRAIEGSGTSGYSHLVFRPEVDDEVLVYGAHSTGASYWYKFSPEGDLIWQKQMPNGQKTVDAVSLADGTTTTAGIQGTQIFIANFDSDGNRNWVNVQTTSHAFAAEALEAQYDQAGDLVAYWLAGSIHHGHIGTSDPALIVFEPDGEVLWASYYALDDEDETYDILQTSDGNMVLCGRTAADVAAPPRGEPDSGNVIKNATNNGLLMKLDTNGELIWANAYSSKVALSLLNIAESPQGLLYVSGAAFLTIKERYPSVLVGMFSAEGELLNHVTIGEDPDWPDELPSGGHTPYDTPNDIIWTEEGPWVCGITGLGPAASAWIMGLTEELGVRFFTVFEGPARDGLLSMAETPYGMLALGHTQSMLPWGSGGRHTALLMQLPWEGFLRLHPDTRIDTLLLQPQVFHSSSDIDFMVSSTVPSTPPTRYFNNTSPVPFTRQTLGLTQEPELALPMVDTFSTVQNAEFAAQGDFDDYSDWAAYHHLSEEDADPLADHDNDGVANLFEAYFGTNPWRAETGESPIDLAVDQANGAIALSYKRVEYANLPAVAIETAEDLRLPDWAGVEGATTQATSLGNGYERVTVEVPISAVRQYFRLRGSEL